ncbi:hypothetical protein [Moritella sp. F3]|uniref:hypothetical protein n=1 Tax=Moritella sp. F3 TaxID=2718882 RepID=UPI0018E18324|nr:hypothetical protein [Moritella sp. F3]GIC77637.1 hypothetical protein FMO001_23640 [Moritella sp. F1]GIC82050.1 hypothetical protein FMO003_23310 [Moritella sp. F3]
MDLLSMNKSDNKHSLFCDVFFSLDIEFDRNIEQEDIGLSTVTIEHPDNRNYVLDVSQTYREGNRLRATFDNIDEQMGEYRKALGLNPCKDLTVDDLHDHNVTSTMFMSLGSDVEFVKAKLHYSDCGGQYQINTQVRVKSEPL